MSLTITVLEHLVHYKIDYITVYYHILSINEVDFLSLNL